MRTLKYFIACTLMFLSFAANSQNREIQKKDNTNLYDFFSQNIKYPEEPKQQNPTYAVFVKIKISSKGGIRSIDFSETSDLVKNEIIRICKLKGAKIIFARNPNMTLIIPIIFNYTDLSKSDYNYNEMFENLMDFFKKNQYNESKYIKYFPPLVAETYALGITIND